MADQTTHQISIFATLHDRVSKGFADITNKFDKANTRTKNLNRENQKLSREMEIAWRRLSSSAREYLEFLEKSEKRLDRINKNLTTNLEGRVSFLKKGEAAKLRRKEEWEHERHLHKLSELDKEYIDELLRLNEQARVIRSGEGERGFLPAKEQAGRVTDVRERTSAFNRENAALARLRNGYQQLKIRAADVNDESSNMVNLYRIVRRETDDNRIASQRLSRTMIRLGRVMFGLAIASVIAFMQSLLSSLTAVISHVIALAGSLATAAGVLGGTFVAGLAQAIPMLGLFGAAMSRLSIIGEALNQQQLAEKQAYGDTTEAVNDQKDSVEAIIEAQKALTDARREARREIEDLMLAEKQAYLGFRDSQNALDDAIQEGGIGAVEEAYLDRQQARLELQRAREDAGRAKRGGVAGMDQVIAATKALSDAHEQAAEAADAQSAAVDNLAYYLNQLTPAERKLYQTIVRLKGRLNKELGGITDNIISAFTFGLLEAEKAIDNSDLIERFKKLAKAAGRELRGIFRFLTSERNIDFLGGITDNARKNLKPIVQTAKNLFSIFRDIAEAAAPALALVLEGINTKIGELKESVGNNKTGLMLFFLNGIDHLRHWGRLIKNVVIMFATLFGASNESAKKGLDDLNTRVEDATKNINENFEEVQNFFNETQVAFGYITDIIVRLGEALVNSFDPEAVKALRDILVNVLIPALETAIIYTGFFIIQLDKLFKMKVPLPFVDDVGDIAEIALAFMLIKGSLGIILTLLGPIGVLIKTILWDLLMFFGKSFVFSQFGQRILTAIGGSGGKLKKGISKLGRAAGIAFGWAFNIASTALIAVGQGAQSLMGRMNAKFPRLKTFFAKYGARLGLAFAAAFITLGMSDENFRNAIFDKMAEVFVWVANKLEGLINFLIDAINKVIDKVDDFPGVGDLKEIGPVSIDDPYSDNRAYDPNKRNQKEADRNRRAALTGVQGGGQTAKELREQAQAANEASKGWGGLADNIARARNRSKDYVSQGDKLDKAHDKQRKGVKKLGRTFGGLIETFFGTGKQSRELGQVIKGVTNKVLNAFGAETLTFDIPSIARVAGNVLGMFAGNQTGGWMGQRGERKPDDRLIGVAGGEAVLTGHQQSPVEMAMAFANSAGIIPYRNLDDLFSRDKRAHISAPRYKSGGRVSGSGNFPTRFPDADGALPGLDVLAWFLKKNFGLRLIDGLRPGGITTSGNISDHAWGGAIDVSNGASPTAQMDSAAKWLARNLGGGSWSSNFSGGAIKQMLYRTDIGGNHYNHIHVALLEEYARNASAVLAMLGGSGIAVGSGGLGGALEKIKRIMVKGKDGPLKQMLQKQSDRLVKGSNKYLQKKLASLGGLSGLGGTYSGHGEVLTASQVAQIAEQALTMLAKRGLIPKSLVNQSSISALVGRARQESNFDPDAVNNWDSNAAAGHPSTGLMQTIGPTFNAYRLRGFGNIYNPLHNMLAAIRYMMDTYGHIVGPSGSGYQFGGIIPEFNNGGVVPGPKGKPTLVLAHGQETFIPTHQTGGFVDVNQYQKEAIQITNKAQRANKFKKLAKLLDDLTREGGSIEDISAAIEELAVVLGSKLTLWAYKIRNNVVAKIVTNVDMANKELDNLESIGDELDQELKIIQRAIKVTKAKKQKTKDKKKKDKLQGAINMLQTNASSVLDLINQNMLDQIQGQENVFNTIMDTFSQRIQDSDLMQQIIQLQGEISGNVNTNSLIAQIKNKGSILQEQRQFLLGELSKAQGIGDIELVKSLQTALLENQIAILENTKELKETNGTLNKAFSFTSTAWQVWRQAIFNGMGGLLPQYMPVPSLATGGLVTKTGLVNIHAGEVVKKAGGHDIGELNINITEPMTVADETALAASIAWRMKNLKV